jgi:DNA repair exonuclease SbcCD ATPase subunit
MGEDIEEIKREVQQLRTWLSQLDSRMTQMETQRQQANQPLLREVRVPERGTGILGGRTVSTQKGALEREIRTPVCDVCGRSLTSEEFAVCSCGKKLDLGCVKYYKTEALCIDCLFKKLPLTKQNYLVLTCIANGITDVRTISKLTRILSENVRSSLEELLSAKLIAREGMLVFSNCRATKEGLEAISAFRQVYGQDYDVWVFDKELRKYLRERSRASRIFAR